LAWLDRKTVQRHSFGNEDRLMGFFHADGDISDVSPYPLKGIIRVG